MESVIDTHVYVSWHVSPREGVYVKRGGWFNRNTGVTPQSIQSSRIAEHKEGKNGNGLQENTG